MFLRTIFLFLTFYLSPNIYCQSYSQDDLKKQSDKLEFESAKLWREMTEEKNDSVKTVKMELYSRIDKQYKQVGEQLRLIQISTIKQKLKTNIPDSLKCSLLLELVAKFKGLSLDSSLFYSKIVLDITRKNKLKVFEISTLRAIGGVYEALYRYDSALYYFNQGREKAILYKYEGEIPYAELFNICFYLGNYPYAMELCVQGLPWAEKTGNKHEEANFHNILAYVSNKQGNRGEAHKHYRTYLSLAENLKDSGRIAHAYREWSAVFFDELRLDSALHYLMKAYSFYKLVYTSNSFSAAIMNTVYKISLVYKSKGDYKTALKYAGETVKTPINLNAFDVPLYYINLGDIYLRLNEAQQAFVNYHHGLSFAKTINHKEDIRDAYYSLSEFYRYEKRFDSTYYYYYHYINLKDSVTNEKTQQNIAFMQSQFDTERKDQQIKDQQAKLKRQSFVRNIIIGSSVVLLLVASLFYNSYRLKQKNKFQQQLNKQQNELMNTVIITQDKERKRIAEDLHDSIGSILSAAKLKLSAIAETASVNGNGQQDTYDDTMNLLDEAVNEMRNISHNLLPASLLRLGLVPGLQNLFDRISSKSGLQISFNTFGFKNRLDESIEVSIYRIILEAVNNVIKHAMAKNLTVQLMQYDNYINILVEDDGIGFDNAAVSKQQGIGLNNIYSRVDYMKGKMDVDTKPKAGTVINIDIPYQPGV